MKKFIILVVFIGSIRAQITSILTNPLPTTGTTGSQSFPNCGSPTQTPCAPFDTLATTNANSLSVILNTIASQGTCDSTLTAAQVPSLLIFNIYKKGQPVQIVNGVDFMANPDNYLDLTCSCIRFFLGGFMTDFKIDPKVAASANDWRTFCAGYLNDLLGCIVVVINWGSVSGENYFCLGYYDVPLIGQQLGIMFYKYFNLKNLYLVGHSLGGHIFAFACDTVWNYNTIHGGGIVYELTVLDLAGMMYKNNKCLLVPELFTNVMRPTIATRTIAVYSNPCFMGIGNFAVALINIIVNYPFCVQPGYNFNPLYNHAFAALLYAAFCANVQCFVALINVNPIFSTNLQGGTFYLTVSKCYPFCCY